MMTIENNNFILNNIKKVFHKSIDMRELCRTPEWKISIANEQKRISDLLRKDTSSIYCCPICDSKNHIIFVEIFQYPYHQCKDCGHIFSQTPPSAENIKALYADTGSERVKAVQADIYGQKDLYDQRVKNITLPKAKFLTEKISQDGIWVDIGAGVGDLVKALKLLNWDVIGLESDTEEVKFAKLMGVNLENIVVDELNIGSYLEHAKVISLINVLEHLLNPHSLIESISKNVESGVYIVIEVPRHPSISSLSNQTFPNFSARHIYPPDHLHIYTENSLDLLLSKYKFQIEVMWLFGQDVFEVFTNMEAQSSIKDQGLINKILNITNDLQKIVDENELSDTMLIIAKKI